MAAMGAAMGAETAGVGAVLEYIDTRIKINK